jgi:hypothetical protein
MTAAHKAKFMDKSREFKNIFALLLDKCLVTFTLELSFPFQAFWSSPKKLNLCGLNKVLVFLAKSHFSHRLVLNKQRNRPRSAGSHLSCWQSRNELKRAFLDIYRLFSSSNFQYGTGAPLTDSLPVSCLNVSGRVSTCAD